MAWSTCPYCQKKENGWSNAENHKRREHPAEYQIADAQKTVEWAEERLARNTKAKEEYAVLDAAVDRLVDGLVRGILTKERDSRRITRFAGYEKGTVAIPFDEQIAEDTAWLAQKRAELAALQIMEVTA